MLAKRFLETCIEVLTRVIDEQTAAIAASAELIVDAIATGHRFFAFGCSHSGLPVQDVYYRAGGLILVNPIIPPGLTLDVRPPTMTSAIERMEGYGRVIFDSVPAQAGDVLVLLSTSGRNPVPIDVAMAARERGLKVIVITSMLYTEAVSTRHASGKKAHEFADVVIDNYSPVGDAVLDVPGLPQRTGSTSGIVGSALMHAIVSQVVEGLVARGITPPIYVSGNLDGGAEHNARMLAEYAGQIHYL